ncbi:iron ABC transporter permease [uncultured Corynebacterium sp.]|uniref:FecCD family ABC transporter permease n=1 Tax=uncultured Corynebacterium sp. TaxID=159447 RepID=UPI0025D4415E|nr:iron ABC transporter permease [uncultured Corynebacterium sp.]
MTQPSRTAVRPQTYRWIILALALASVGIAALASLFLGVKATAPSAVVDALTGAPDPYMAAVLDARIDRTVVGIVCGAALAMSGVIIQGITRNPLGEPGLLGVTVGSSAAVVTVAAVTGQAIAGSSVWVAFSGALATTIAVYAIGTRTAQRSVVGLLLTGAVISAVLSAYIQTIILTHPAVFDSYRFWVIGALGGRDLGAVADVAPLLLAGIILAAVLGPSLNNLALGEDVASSLGTPIALVRAGGLIASALLAAAATAVAGPITFVGLVVPHLARSLVGIDHHWQVPIAALLGATLLVAADVVGRTIARPEEIMVGIITAVIGAPFLLLAVRRGWLAS